MRLLWDAARAQSGGVEHIGLRPNEHDAALSSVADRLFWEQLRFPSAAYQAGAASGRDSLIYSPALGAPLCPPAPLVANVNDLIPQRYPQQFNGAAGWYWKTLLPATWRRARIITVSNASLVGEVSEGLGYPAEQIRVVPYYPDPRIVRMATALLATGIPRASEPGRKPGFVTLGSHEPRKNIELAIRALALLRERGIRADLVCIGAHNSHTRRLQALAASLGLEGAVSFPGYLSLEDATQQLLSATALLSPSLYEGFGLPPLEALSIGVPAIVSEIACHRAVYGAAVPRIEARPKDAVMFVSPQDAGALAEAMESLVQNPAQRSELARRGKLFAGTLTAQACAEALRSAFEAAITSL